MLALLLALGLSATGLMMTSRPAAAVPIEDEQLFLSLVNRLRVDQGLSTLVVDRELTAEARSWTTVMAADDLLAHSADITRGITAPWTVLGENVGRHRVHKVEQLFQAFVASPTHYENLVDPRFTSIGIGVVHGSGDTIWTTHRFMAVAPAGPPVTAAPPAGGTTAAPPTTAASPTTEVNTTTSTNDDRQATALPDRSAEAVPGPAGPTTTTFGRQAIPRTGDDRSPCRRCRFDRWPTPNRPGWVLAPHLATPGGDGRHRATAGPFICRSAAIWIPMVFNPCWSASR